MQSVNISLVKNKKTGLYTKTSGKFKIGDKDFNGIVYKVILSEGPGFQSEYFVYKVSNNSWVDYLTMTERNIKKEIMDEIDRIESSAAS